MEQTQDAVLDSAARCFARYGFRKTSIDTIAAEAHVAKGTVYLYCANKQELFYQAVHRELAAWIDELSDLIDPDVPADQILAEMGRRDAAFVEERPLVADLLSGLHDGELPAWKEQFAELRDLAISHVVEVLRLGIRQGVFADDLDVAATARVLQEMQLSGALLRHRTDLGIRQVRRQQSAALRLVLKGLEARSAT
jgi:TetR/AcrR family fatty acid metabolism transcriptional regulator